MNNDFSLKYYDRYTKQIISERIFAKEFLIWAYNTTTGRFFTQILFRQKFVSKFYGWWHKQSWSKKKIKPFIKKMNVNMRESLKSTESFKSFNDFFTREIDLSHRPVNQDDEVCVAPCDGRVMVYPKINLDNEFHIKRSSFKLGSFLQDDNLEQKYSGGSMLISRLYLTDYHHFHFPDSGLPKKSSAMDGKYYATSPYSISSLTPFYTENHRMLTQFESDNFGEIVISEIGAFTVGSIKQQYQPDVAVGKGDHKGFFELGGSTIVLLFEKGVVNFDSDLIRNSKYDLETYVRQGDSIGRSVKINNNNIQMEIDQ